MAQTEIIKDLTILQFNEKVVNFPSDKWIVHSYHACKKTGGMYRLMLYEASMYRGIGAIRLDDLHKAIDDGKVIVGLLSKKKYTRELIPKKDGKMNV